VQKHFLKENLFALKFACVRSSHTICTRAHTRTA